MNRDSYEHPAPKVSLKGNYFDERDSWHKADMPTFHVHRLPDNQKTAGMDVTAFMNDDAPTMPSTNSVAKI
jgi:hypothetical protein